MRNPFLLPQPSRLSDLQNDLADARQLEVAEGGETDDEVEEEEVDVEEEEQQQLAQQGQNREVTPNPCSLKRCRRGEMCKLRNDKPVCVCDTRCSEEVDKRFWVCSTKNATFHSECHLDREHCLCKRQQAQCSNRRHKKVQLDYYGECRDITPCPKDEFEEFPYRMREWLFVIMKQLAARQELADYLDLLRNAKRDSNHSDAVIWKFCDLDKSPQDRQVSRRELQFTVQSLKAYEHCLTPFLDFCDANNNRKISLSEWGRCLGVGEDHIENKCKQIRSKAKRQ